MALCLLLCVALVAGIEATLNCQTTGHSTEACNNATATSSASYRELSQKFQDFQHTGNGHNRDSLIYHLIELFKYSYPCASDAVAALYTFVDPLQHQSSNPDWERFWNSLFSRHIGFSDGNDTQLQSLFHKVEAETNYNCLIDLYHYYIEHGGRAAFEAAYDFFTPGPASATHQPTTTQTIPDLTCTVCTGLECLLHRNVQTCPHDKHHCYIQVEDHSVGRSITRGCADQTLCDTQAHNSAHCSDLDQTVSPVDTVCVFCCRTPDCNNPPAITVHLQPI